MQNIGKTVAVLQMARNIARSGRALAIVVCYEHSPLYRLHRLPSLEPIDPTSPTPARGPSVLRPEDGGVTRDLIDTAVVEGLQRGESVSSRWLLEHVPGASEVWQKVQEQLEGLWLILGDGRRTTADVLELYPPSTCQPGSSYSHLDQIFSGTENALMIYSRNSGAQPPGQRGWAFYGMSGGPRGMRRPRRR